MRIAIMQPYLFPYIGYFQLINAVDKFVIADDVQYIRHGWINRNRFLLRGRAHLISLSLKKDSVSLNVNERDFADNMRSQVKKMLKTLQSAYARAPHFKQTFELVEKILNFSETNVSLFVAHSLQMCCDHLGIKTPFCFDSSFKKDRTLGMQEKIFLTSKALGADHYLNPIGGIELYSKEEFTKNGIKLEFLKTGEIRYKQFGNQFIPNLSIVDVMMFNSVEKISKMLTQYEVL